MQPAVREALFLASPRLVERLEEWPNDPDGPDGRRLEPLLAAYLARACTRATPFGLWAGCSVGVVGDAAALRLPPLAGYRRHTRLDQEYVAALARAVEADAAIRRALTYRTTTSLDAAAGGWRITVTRGAQHHLVALERSPHLDATVDRARTGASWAALCEPLVGGGVTLADAEAFVATLVRAGLLVSSLAPAVTGDEPGPALAAALTAQPETARLGERLAAAHEALAALDAEGLGAGPEHYPAISSILAGLPVPPPPERLVEVDLHKPAAIVLPAAVVTEVARGAELLRLLAVPAQADDLSRFRDGFGRRYGSREVPIMDALDGESGVGFSTAPGPDRVWSERDDILLQLLSDALRDGDGEIELAADDLDRLASPDPDPLPDAFHALAVVAATSEAALTAGDFRVYLDHCEGPSGARLLGRFCHSSPELDRFVRAHLRSEEAARPEAVFAEVVHSPGVRAASLRPVLRRHEIPYLGRSGVPEDAQVPVGDLMVSVDEDRVVLRSLRLGREVLPRLTSAHDPSSAGAPIYRFLGALAAQGVVSHLTWDWGALSGAPFLPRVTSGRLVLSRATWNVNGPERAAFDADAWRKRHGAGRFVVVADEDRQLACDLDNPLSVAALARALRRAPDAPLVEFYPGPEELCVRGPEGRFVHEVVVPFEPARTGAPAPPAPRRAVATGRRRFPPGSEWLYAKLYAGEANAERALTRTLGPLVRSLVGAGSARSWFFVLEADPDPHLRLRLHGDPDRVAGEALPAITAAAGRLIDAGLAWRLSFDTYEREVERYGGDRGVHLAESIFAADSEAVLDILATLGGAALDARRRVALAGIDRLFDDIGLDLVTKAALARRAREDWEAGASIAQRRAEGRRFRSERAEIVAVLERGEASDPLSPAIYALDGGEASDPLSPAVAALEVRSARVAPACAELRSLAGAGALGVGLADFAASVAHMHAGRMLRSAVASDEPLIYGRLDRHYTSRAARPSPR